MDMGPKCTMNMLWSVLPSLAQPVPPASHTCHLLTRGPARHRNTQIVDTCVVFRSWHISSRFTFALSFVAIILISVGYEWLRTYQRAVDQRIALALARGKGRDKGSVSGRSSPEVPGQDVEEAGLLTGRARKAAGSG